MPYNSHLRVYQKGGDHFMAVKLIITDTIFKRKCEGKKVSNLNLLDTSATLIHVSLDKKKKLKQLKIEYSGALKYYIRDIEILGWCPTWSVLPHGKNVPL